MLDLEAARYIACDRHELADLPLDAPQLNVTEKCQCRRDADKVGQSPDTRGPGYVVSLLDASEVSLTRGERADAWRAGAMVYLAAAILALKL